MPVSSIPWPDIEAEYIVGPNSVTTVALAEKYGISSDHVGHVCTRKGWTKKREEYRANAAQAATQKSIDRIADHVAEISESFARRFAREGLDALDMARNANPNDKRNLVWAAGICHSNVRLALGLHTDSQRLENAADGKLDEKLAQVIAQMMPEASPPSRPEEPEGNGHDKQDLTGITALPEGEPTEGES